jgi:hypothetical protein
LPEVCGLLARFAMDPDIGHGVEPLPGGRIEDAEVGFFGASEKFQALAPAPWRPEWT